MGRYRIPEVIDKFHNYINVSADYLLAMSGSPPQLTWLRLGLTNANATDWNARKTYWSSTLFPKYTNPEICTSAVRAEVRNFIKQFREFANPLINIMAASSAVIVDDEYIFNFVKTRKGPTRRRTSISEECFTGITLKGGASFGISCRMLRAEGRPRMAPGADSVQMSYTFSQTMPDPSAVHPEGDAMNIKISSRAHFHFSAGITNVGKWLAIYTRWYNMRHPELAGSWSNMSAVMVS